MRQVLHNVFTVGISLIRYNLKIIFANKFIYFLLAALLVFLFVTTVNLLSEDAQTTESTVFVLLLVPGILLIFYPVTFGIQNDVDNRMIEILFGIPNYRYKIWLFRVLLIFAVTFVILFLLSLLSSIALTVISISDMMYHLMFPILFLGCASFMMSTLIRNGSGTAVVMVIFGIINLIARDFFEDYPRWDIFINPFDLPQNMNEAIWAEVVFENKIYLLVGCIITLLFGLLNLQNREKFL